MQIDRGEVGMSASVQVRGQLMRIDSLRPFIMESEDQAQVLRVGSKAPLTSRVMLLDSGCTI